jgi:hypothetical protein
MKNRISRLVLSATIIAFAMGTSSLQVTAKANTSTKAALKTAGVAALPVFLDAATNKISITMPKALGGKKLSFGGTVDAAALAEKKFVFTTLETKKLNWNNAFGMKFLDLKKVALNITVEKGAFSISLDGMLGGAFKSGGKSREVVIDLAVEDNKLSDFALSLPGSKLSLHSISDLKNIPGASTFAIEDPTISMHAISGKVDFVGETVDAVVFYDTAKKDWNIGLEFEKALTLAQLTGHKGGFLDHLGLPAMRVIASTKGLKAAYEDLPLAAQNFFASSGELPEGDLTLAQGVNVIAQFDPALAADDLKKVLKTLGLGSTTLEVDGVVEGMFGGKPAVELSVDIDTPSGHSFKFLKAKDVKAEFFMKLSEAESALGFRTAIGVGQGKGKPDLEFDVDFEFAAQSGEAEVQVAGGMKGDWINAAGIKGLTLENPFLSVGINETGSFDMLIDGTVMIGHEKIRAAADMVLSPEALGLPTAIALAGEINKLDFNALTAHAKKSSKMKGGGFKHMNVEFKDVAFAFMTPGAHLPADLEEELEIEGAGIALKATLLVNKKELGSAKGYASTEGISFDGKIDPFKLGPLNLKEAELEIAAGPSVDPKFAMSGDIVLFKGFEEKYVLDLEPSKFKFSSDTKFGGAFDVFLEAESQGLSFAASNDFSFEADLAANYSKAFRNLVQDALKGLKKADSAMKKAKSDVSKAEKKVKGLKTKIASEKAKAKKAFDAATKKIDGAKKKVDKLKKTIAYNKKKAHDVGKKAKKYAKHLKLGKAAKEGVEEGKLKTAIAAEEAALKTADWALKTAKKSVKIVPLDAAPKVVALAAQLVTEEAGLKVAEGVLDASLAANKGVESAVKAVAKGVTALKINKIGVSGSLKGITSGGHQGKSPDLAIDVSIHGKHHVYHVGVGSVKSTFEKIAAKLAKSVADELLKFYK